MTDVYLHSYQDLLRKVTIKYLTQVLIAASATAAVVWIHAQVTHTNTPFYRAFGLFLTGTFLILAYATHKTLVNLKLLVWSGYAVLSSYYIALMVYAAWAGPEYMMYLVALTMAWAGMPYVYAYIFLGAVAERVSILYAVIISCACAVSYAELWFGGHQDIKSIQPYFSTIVAQWCYVVGQRMVPQILAALYESQKAAVAREAFIAMAGHEVRTPLQSIISCADLLALKVDSPIAVRTLERMRGACVQMESVLNNASALLRPGRTHDLTPTVTSFDLRQLAEQLVEEFERRATDKGLRIALECSDPVLVQVSGDQARVLQVLTNLMSNAVKYTDQGYVLLRVVVLSSARIRFSVEDSGIGIPADYHQAIFEPFYRAPTAMDRTVEGSGLGLAVVKREVSVMDGTVSVASTPGKGSIFSVEIPIRSFGFEPKGDSVIAPANKPYPDMGSDCAHARVLVVDDCEDIRLIAKDLLESAGASCWTAASGELALRFLSVTPVDVVLLDIQMPGMDGFEVIKTLRRQGYENCNRDVPVVAISASEVDTSREGSDFFTAYVRKPFHLDEMTTLVLRLVTQGERRAA